MDRWHALPGVAPDGGQRLDQVSLGGDGERTQAQILLNQKVRSSSPEGKARTMDDDFFRPQRIMERTTCLISNSPSQNGGGRCCPPASRIQTSWTNWKVICARIGRGGWSREKARSRHLRERCKALARQACSNTNSQNSAEKSARGYERSKASCPRLLFQFAL